MPVPVANGALNDLTNRLHTLEQRQRWLLAGLAEQAGFVLKRVKGSHHIYFHPTAGMLNLQKDRDGKAKPYQVKQLLDMIDAHRLEVT